MSLNTISLSGNGWRQNYYRAEYHREQHEYDIHNIHIQDGLGSGANGVDFDDSEWLPAVVPGDVRDGLIAAGRMSDPYFDRNSDQCRWVENFEWWFRRKVFVPAQWENLDISLIFDGVDYIASYYWDGELIGSSSDMFVQQRFDLTGKATPGVHVLAVRISPPPKSSSNHFLNGDTPPRTYHHKMQCSWGWDWVRELVSMGIWDDVRIEAHRLARISDTFVQAKPEANCKADIGLEITVENPASKKLFCDVQIFDPDDVMVAQAKLELPGKNAETTSVMSAALSIDNAQLWWPNGYGLQPIYKAVVHLNTGDTTCDKHEVEFGIRKIEMRRNPGSPDEAYPLTFTVNDVPVFASGANWVPADMLPGRIDSDRYRHLLSIAKLAGFTMLRMWGGGLIEKRDFYRQCDRLGIMVWQEFPLSCSNYPETKEFLDAKKIEADFVIRNLRNHPCISLWCGGNEMQYYNMSPEHPVLKIFEQAVARLHPGIDYHVSSPDKSRIGERDHGPWYFHEPHTFWNEHFRYFASEFGYKSPPDEKSLRNFIPASELEMHAGQSFSHHFCALDTYDGLKSFDARTLDEKIFYGQLTQAELLQYAMGVKRSRFSEVSGSLIWQFNSVWPEGAWGLVDYYGVPKMAVYWLAESTAPRAILVTDGGWELNPAQDLHLTIHAITGLLEVFDADISLEAWTQTGQLIYETATSLNVIGAGPASTWKVTVPAGVMSEGIMLVRTIMSIQGKVIARSDRMYAVGTWKNAAKNIAPSMLKVEKISSRKIKIKNTGSSASLVTRLSSADACFDMNYFNLLPGEARTVTSDRPIRQVEIRDWTNIPEIIMLTSDSPKSPSPRKKLQQV